MPYVSGSPLYASADGQPIRYASLDGVELWRAPGAQIAGTRRFTGTSGYRVDMPTGMAGFTLELEIENWEPAPSVNSLYLFQSGMVDLVQRLNGTNPYALQARVSLEAGGNRYFDFNSFNSIGWRNGIFRLMVTPTACYVELSGSGAGGTQTSPATTATQKADASGYLLLRSTGVQGVLMDVKRARYWPTYTPNYWAPTTPPLFEFDARRTPPGPVGDLRGTLPPMGRPFDGRPFDHYGRAPAEIVMHYDPSLATRSATTGYVSAMQNVGGMISAYNTSKSGTGNITVVDGKIVTPQGGSTYFGINNALDLNGHRVFFLMQADAASVGNLNLFGASISTAAGQRTNVQWHRGNASLQLVRWNGTSMAAMGNFPLPEPMTERLRLYELQLLDGTGSLWVDGAHIADQTFPGPDFLMNRYLSAYNTPTFQGLSGDFIAMKADTTPEFDAAVVDIREHLAAKYNIALAA